MIKPTALWNLAHECEVEDAENLGKILLLCVGKEVKLDRAWRIHANVVLKDAADLDERIEEKRAKEREKVRKHRAKDGAAQDEQAVTQGNEPAPGVTRCNADTGGVTRCNAPYIHTYTHTHTPSPTQTNTNRSDTDGVGIEIGSVNVELLKSRIEAFKQAARKDEGAFFDPLFDPVVIACAITKETESARRWRTALNKLGEDVMRDELFSFYREIASGEVPHNRGAALNARLTKKEGGV